jgi:hypothetical protein
MKQSDREGLLIVDVQNDFCPGGALAVPGGDEIVPVVNKLAAGFPHVILTQDWHPAGHASFASSHPGKKPFDTIEVSYGQQTLWPDHCVQGTQGAAFHPRLDVPHAELVLRKGYRRANHCVRTCHRFLCLLFGRRRSRGRFRSQRRDERVPWHRYGRLNRSGNTLDE